MRTLNRLISDYYLEQCFFGEHRLNVRPNDIVCIVESEKTAIICALKYPGFVWLATGGKAGFSEKKFAPLAGRIIRVFADADADTEWREKVHTLSYKYNIKLINWMEPEDVGTKKDIADKIIECSIERKESLPQERQTFPPRPIGEQLIYLYQLSKPQE